MYNTALQCTTLRCSAVHCTLQCTALYIVLPATAHCTAHCTEHCTGAHYHTDVCTVHSAVRESAGVSVRAAPRHAEQGGALRQEPRNNCALHIAQCSAHFTLYTEVCSVTSCVISEACEATVSSKKHSTPLYYTSLHCTALN